jgi:predicted TIM-barrel fold metal-dependent hydrolase
MSEPVQQTAPIDARVRLPKHLRPAEAPPHSGYTSRYDAVLATETSGEKTRADLLDDMQAAGVGGAVVHAEYEYGEVADALNDAVALLVAEESRVVAGIGTVSMLDTPPMHRVRQARAVAGLGLAGLNIQPSFFGMPMDDRSLYPLYTAAAEENLVVFLHTGVNYTAHRPIKNDHPLQLDQVACDFPELRLVACHGGWPFVPEMVAVARKHPQVFLDFGGLAPKYVGRPGTGWDALFGVMGSLLSRQVLFATDWPVFSMERALREWAGLSLPEATLPLLLHGNITRLLNGTT